MNSETSNIRDAWEERQNQLGNSKRSVLFKNLPNYFNNRIHLLHIHFILNALNDEIKKLLDVGCGYGRISKELLGCRPELEIEGVELSASFANYFERNIGSCFQGSLQEFEPIKQYDAIVIVTVLMYLNDQERSSVLEKLWRALRPGGVLICIEPVENLFILLRRKYRVRFFEPTGKNKVGYFKNNDFIKLFSFSDATIGSQVVIGLLPVMNVPALHRGVVIAKR